MIEIVLSVNLNTLKLQFPTGYEHGIDELQNERGIDFSVLPQWFGPEILSDIKSHLDAPETLSCLQLISKCTILQLDMVLIF